MVVIIVIWNDVQVEKDPNHGLHLVDKDNKPILVEINKTNQIEDNERNEVDKEPIEEGKDEVEGEGEGVVDEHNDVSWITPPRNTPTHGTIPYNTIHNVPLVGMLLGRGRVNVLVLM